ncbi:MAG TPA: hypothetical protein VI010_02630 [Xanthobacteraceae bacterium]
MTGRSPQIGAQGFAVRAAVAACAVFLVVSALAQDARPPAEIPRPGEGAPPAAAESNSLPRPGFVDAIGRWLDDGTTKFRTDWQGAQQTFDQLTDQTRDAAKDATGAVMAWPNVRIVPVRERCAVSAGGGPDCQAAAATAACRGKGFGTGNSLDTQSEQKCPAQVLLRGRAASDAECRTETFATRALCQ